jgi:hypothetical protein
MKTYNLGKIEVLRNPRNELKRLVPSSYHEENNSGFIKVYGYYKDNISEALDNLGFRLPSVKECVYLYSFFKEVNEFEYRRFWVYTDQGVQVLLFDEFRIGIWSNPPESLKYILFAVEGAIPS